MTTTDPVPTVGRVPAPPARVALAAIRVLPGCPCVDGAWWPRSRDLSRELPALTDTLDDGWGRVTRVTVDPTGWPVVPRVVRVTGRTVRVGWFLDERHPYELILLSHAAGRCELLVIPPETTGSTAGWPAHVAAVLNSLLTADGFADGVMDREEGSRSGGAPPAGVANDADSSRPPVRGAALGPRPARAGDQPAGDVRDTGDSPASRSRIAG